MSKAINIAIILTAYDRATRVLNDAVTTSERRLRGLRQSSQQAFGLGLAQIGAGVALAAPIVKATEAAIGFEDKMADVAKVMNLTVGSGQFLAMGEEAKELGVYLGRSAQEAAGLMASLATGGVAANQMAEVGKIAGEIGVAFSMTAEEAGTAFVKIQNALGATTAETKGITDAINMLSDSMASEAREIVDFMASGGSSVAASFRIGGKEAAAFGSTLISVGKSSAESATIFERFAKGVFKNADLRKIFENAGGGSEGLVAVLEAGTKAKDQFSFFRKFGEYGSDIALLASRGDLLKSALSGVADQTKTLNSVNNEFRNRNSTTQGSINRMKASLDVLIVNLGSVFLPTLNRVFSGMAKIAGIVGKWASDNPRLAKTIGMVVATASGIMILVGAFNVLKGAVLAVNVMMAANPIGAAVAVIALLATVVIANWDKIGPWFKNLWAKIVGFFVGAWEFIKGLFMKYTVWGLIITHWSKLTAFFAGLWGKVKEIFFKFIQFIAGLPKAFFEFGVNMIKGLVDGIKAMASRPIEAIKEMASKIKSKFTNLLGINSPSRVFVEFGQHISTGAQMGMQSGLGKVQNASQSIANAVISPTSQPNYGASNSGTISLNYSPVINISSGSGGEKSEFMALLRSHKDEIARIVQDAKNRQLRTSY